MTPCPKPVPEPKAAPRRIARGSRPRRQRKTNLAALKRRLWALFARYVKDRDGPVCWICGAAPLEGQNWHAGHLVSIRHASTAYHPDNVHSNCASCNVFQRGNIAAYANKFLEVYGEDKFRALFRLSRETKRWTAPEVRELIAALEVDGVAYECLYAERYGLPNTP